MTAIQSAAATWCLTALLGVPSPAGTVIPFTTVERSCQSQIETPREVLVRTSAEWKTLWRQHAPDQPVPNIDFRRFMIVGVFLGSRPTGGYAVEVTKVESTGDALVVTYREQRPPPDAMTTQVITSPAHFVRVPVRPGPVRFERAH